MIVVKDAAAGILIQNNVVSFELVEAEMWGIGSDGSAGR
jgi:hypothetical protein